MNSWVDMGMLIVNSLGVIVTSILTIYIFKQNVKLNLKNSELLEEQLMQNKLICKLQERPFLENGFKQIYKTYNLISSIIFGLKEKESEIVYIYLKNILEENSNFFENIDYNFDILIAIVDSEMKEYVVSIKNSLIDIEKQISLLILLNEKKLSESTSLNFEKIIDNMLDLCREISDTQKQMVKLMKKSLLNNL